MSDLSDRAVALHQERRDQTTEAKVQMLRTRHDVCTRYAAKVLEVPASSLKLDMQYGREADPKTWIFRTEGMQFWVKWVGGKEPCNLYVVSGTDGGLPFKTLEQLGMWINNGHVAVRS